MGIILNRRRVCGGAKSLPYDAEVEYLENKGRTQYIDTGIIGGEGLKIQTLFTSREIRIDAWAFGSYSPPSCRIYPIYQYPTGKWGGGYGMYFDGNVNIDINTTYELTIEYTSTAQIITANGVQVANFAKTDYTENIRTLWMFGLNNNNLSLHQPFWCNFGPTKIWLSDVLVRDFIPVRVGQVGYMYDKVSKQLFGNAGTGNFTLGPDKGSAVRITQQQQHEMYGE